MIAYERRDLDGAEHWHKESLAIRERIGDDRGRADTLYQLGRVAEEKGNLLEAEAQYRQAGTIIRTMNHPDNFGVAQHSLQRVQNKIAGSD